MSITEFLLARIAEDEAVAVAAEPHEEWISVGKIEDGGMGTADGEHVARWSPARVMAECEAKRRIVEEWRTAQAEADAGHVSGKVAAFAFTLALRSLVLPYADHPDFDPAWRVA